MHHFSHGQNLAENMVLVHVGPLHPSYLCVQHLLPLNFFISWLKQKADYHMQMALKVFERLWLNIIFQLLVFGTCTGTFHYIENQNTSSLVKILWQIQSNNTKCMYQIHVYKMLKHNPILTISKKRPTPSSASSFCCMKSSISASDSWKIFNTISWYVMSICCKYHGKNARCQSKCSDINKQQKKKTSTDSDHEWG